MPALRLHNRSTATHWARRTIPVDADLSSARVKIWTDVIAFCATFSGLVAYAVAHMG